MRYAGCLAAAGGRRQVADGRRQTVAAPAGGGALLPRARRGGTATKGIVRSEHAGHQVCVEQTRSSALPMPLYPCSTVYPCNPERVLCPCREEHHLIRAPATMQALATPRYFTAGHGIG